MEASFGAHGKISMGMFTTTTSVESTAKHTLADINGVVCMSHGDQGAYSISLAWPACCTPQAQDWHLLAWSVDSYLIATGMTPWRTVQQGMIVVCKNRPV